MTNTETIIVSHKQMIEEYKNKMECVTTVISRESHEDIVIGELCIEELIEIFMSHCNKTRFVKLSSTLNMNDDSFHLVLERNDSNIEVSLKPIGCDDGDDYCLEGTKLISVVNELILEQIKSTKSLMLGNDYYFNVHEKVKQDYIYKRGRYYNAKDRVVNKSLELALLKIKENISKEFVDSINNKVVKIGDFSLSRVMGNTVPYFINERPDQLYIYFNDDKNNIVVNLNMNDPKFHVIMYDNYSGRHLPINKTNLILIGDISVMLKLY